MNRKIIILCDEIGCGLVPVDAFEREYREARAISESGGTCPACGPGCLWNRDADEVISIRTGERFSLQISGRQITGKKERSGNTDVNGT